MNRHRIAIVATLLVAALATQSYAQSKCDAAKRKAYGKTVFCLAKVDAKADKTGDPANAASVQKCVDKFGELCAKAETKADCTTGVETCGVLDASAEVCAQASDGPGGTTTTTTTSTTFVPTCSCANVGDACFGCVGACGNDPFCILDCPCSEGQLECLGQLQSDSAALDCINADPTGQYEECICTDALPVTQSACGCVF